MNTLKSITLLVLAAFSSNVAAQETPARFVADSVVIVGKSPEKGFRNDYILFLPKGLRSDKRQYLLVETNNTGKVSDSIEVHKKHALALASVNSIGNNISTELKIPLLVPIFPRPASKELIYSHALDRDVMLEKASELERLDLQLLAMIGDAQQRLEALGIRVHDKILMNGFSASATFTNRFTMLHPDRVKACAAGGLNGELMLPVRAYQGKKFNYPLGTNDIRQIAGIGFDASAYKSVPQFIYMGALDDNDAVQYDDAYDSDEREQINSQLGKTVQDRWRHVQKIYLDQKVDARFSTYPDVGHWTTSKVNLDVILFFNDFVKE